MLLKVKWCHIDREVTPFQVLSVREELRTVMLSQSLKDCKLQNNSSFNVSNQKLAPIHKPIAGWHQSVMHLGERKGIKNRTVYERRSTKQGVIIQSVLKAFVKWPVLCIEVLVRVVVRSKRLRPVFVSPCSLSVVISLPFSSLADLHSSKVTGCC